MKVLALQQVTTVDKNLDQWRQKGYTYIVSRKGHSTKLNDLVSLFTNHKELQMSISLKPWTKKITFSRGPEKAKEQIEDVVVEVPQLDESLPMSEFFAQYVEYVGSEALVKTRVNLDIGSAAIQVGRNSFASSYKKKDTVEKNTALGNAIKAIREYVHGLPKERGAFIAEATQAKNQMDTLVALYEKMQTAQTDEDKKAFSAKIQEVMQAQLAARNAA